MYLDDSNSNLSCQFEQGFRPITLEDVPGQPDALGLLNPEGLQRPWQVQARS
jgi:hypothetical protein